MTALPRAHEHRDFCGWHHDQYAFECDCGAIPDPASHRPPWLNPAFVPVVEPEPRLVILESPYAGDVERNVTYARAALADCLRRGEAPIASHLLYTQPGVLRDGVPEERALGIDAGLAWGRVADAAVFYVNLGWSGGMLAAKERHLREGRPIEERRLSWWDLPV